MSFLNALLDLGFNYGANGGPDDFGTELVVVGGANYANQKREKELGEWELGGRDVDAATLQLRLDHWRAVRGRVYAFPYKDWNEYEVTQQELVLDGSNSTQLIKVSSGFGNDYTANILLPVVSTFVLELQDGGAGPWVELEADTDYTLDATTGVITWPGSTGPAAPDKVRWSGEFNKRVRYAVSQFRAQFLAYEQRGATNQKFYALGPLTVREELLPQP